MIAFVFAPTTPCDPFQRCQSFFNSKRPPSLIRCSTSETTSSSTNQSSSSTKRSHDRAVVITETMPNPWLALPWKQPKRTRQYLLDHQQCIDSFRELAPSTESNEQQVKKLRRSGDILAQLAGPLLPMKWPNSVGPNYARWAFWHIGRHITRNAYYVLGTTSLLLALGLDTKKALALSATLKWVLKDGLAMGTKLIVSTNLARIVDASPKRCRFIGDSLMAISVGVEILSLTNPAYFLIYGSIAALLKDAGGAMSGPAYRVFLDAFATTDNIGDVSSRGEAQVVVGNLIGLGIGVVVTSLLGNLPSDGRLFPTLVCYMLLAIAHLSCTTNAVSAVQLRTLNAQRLDIVASTFESRGVVPDVALVNADEKFIRPWTASSTASRVVIGAPLSTFALTDSRVPDVVSNGTDRFVVAYADGTAGVMLHDDASVTDTLRGVLQARRLTAELDSLRACKTDADNPEDISRVTLESYDWAAEQTPLFVKMLREKGWSTKKLLVGLEGFRYRKDSTITKRGSNSRSAK